MPMVLGGLKLFDVQEISEETGITPRKVRDMLKNREIIGQKVGPKWFVSETALRKFFRDPAAGLDLEALKEMISEYKSSKRAG